MRAITFSLLSLLTVMNLPVYGQTRNTDSEVINATKNTEAASYEEPTINHFAVDANVLDELKRKLTDKDLIATTDAVARVAKENAQNYRAIDSPFIPQKRNEDAYSPKRGQLYVYISSLIPLETLREYARVLEDTRAGILVVNGFIDGMQKVKPTLTWIHNILKKDPECRALDCEIRKVELDINPILFSKYGITRVPAFVWDAAPPGSFCEDDGKTLSEDKRLVVQGAADIFYVLEEIKKRTGSTEIDQLLKEHYQL